MFALCLDMLVSLSFMDGFLCIALHFMSFLSQYRIECRVLLQYRRFSSFKTDTDYWIKLNVFKHVSFTKVP